MISVPQALRLRPKREITNILGIPGQAFFGTVWAIVLGIRSWHASGEPERSNSAGMSERGISRVLPPPRPGRREVFCLTEQGPGQGFSEFPAAGDQQSRSVCTEMANILGIPREDVLVGLPPTASDAGAFGS